MSEILTKRGLYIEQVAGVDVEASDLRIMSALCANTFLRDAITQDLIEDVEAHVIQAERVMILRNCDSRVAGFLCTAVVNTDAGSCLHVQGLHVAPELQAKGIGKHMVSIELVNMPDTAMIAFHTENIGMRGIGESLGVPVALDTAQLTAPLIGTNMQQIEEYAGYLIERGRYGGPLYGQSLGDRLIPGLDQDRGDAQVCVFQVNR